MYIIVILILLFGMVMQTKCYIMMIVLYIIVICIIVCLLVDGG